MAQSSVSQSFRDELNMFLTRRRHAPPHVHRCTECYEDEACGLDCTTDLEEGEAVPRGGYDVCGLCRPPQEQRS